MHTFIGISIIALFINFSHAQHAPKSEEQPKTQNNASSEELENKVQQIALHLACEMVDLPARSPVMQRNDNLQLNPAWIWNPDKINPKLNFEVRKVYQYFASAESSIRPLCDLYMLKAVMASEKAGTVREYCSTIKARIEYTEVLSARPTKIYDIWGIPNPTSIQELVKSQNQKNTELLENPNKQFLQTTCRQKILENTLACEYLELKVRLDSLSLQKEAAKQALMACKAFL